MDAFHPNPNYSIKNPRPRLLALICCLLWPGVAFADEPAPWKAGVAAVTITPEQPMWMAGYAARNRPSEGTEQDLYAKALALEDADGNRLVIVTMDLIGVLRSMRESIERRVAEQLDLQPESLLLNASHTHCGPEIREREGREEEARQYMEFLEQRLFQVISESVDHLAPARLSYSQARAGFAMNRRLLTDAGYRILPNPYGPVDHEVPVLIVESADEETRALLFGYACHNTTLDYYKFCGDYAGYAQEYLEADNPGVTALFITGCGGDQNPYPRRSVELAQQHGRTLATAVEAARTASPRPVNGPLRSVLDDVEVIRIRDSEPEPFPYPVQLIQFGTDVTLVALASEVVVDYSLRLKREMAASDDPTQGPAIWVAGYSNGYFGYIPSARVLREGGYEAGPWDPSIEDRIIGKVHQLNDKLSGKLEHADVPKTP